jgi:hypothetical protein
MKITAVHNKNPKTLGRLALYLLILGLSFSERASAATVQFVGAETAGSNYLVQNWSNSGVTKLYDIGGKEVYGSSGFYQIRPTLYSSPTTISNEAASAGNNLGVTASTPTLYLNPSFLSSVTGGAGNFVNFDGYSVYRGPDGSSLYRQGALSVTVNGGPASPESIPSSYFGVAMNFTVNAGSYFRVGFAVDSVGSGTYAPDYVGLYSGSTGTKVSSLLTRDGNADMAFFDIDTRGDSISTAFAVALWQKDSGALPGTAALSLATFDAIPEPSTAFLALVGMGCLAIHSRRRR